MRNKYTKEFEKFVKENVSKYTKEDFRVLLQDKYNMKISSESLRRYLNRHHIKGKYIDYMKHNVRNVKQSPIGAEKTTKEGVFIKIAQPDIWRRKTRVMYEKYHNCKLSDNDYILFLNRDINDFRKENLIKVSKTEMAYLKNKDMYSKNTKLMKLGILTARLMIKTKEVIKNDNNEKRMV